MAFGASDQARIFSAVSVLEAVPSVIAPLIYNHIYAATVGKLDYAVFFAVAIASIGAFVLLYNAKTTLPLEKVGTPTAETAVESPIAYQEEARDSEVTR